jgi:hypothetical protein
MNSPETKTPKVFQMFSKFLPTTKVREFSEETAPDWLTSKHTVKGSTMDNRWFWEDHILKLEVGESKDTDFHTIKRIS